MTHGGVVRAEDVPAEYPAPGVTVRLLMTATAPGAGPARPGLCRSLVEIAPQARHRATTGAGGELWFTLSGSGRLSVPGHARLELRSGQGLRLPAGAPFELTATGPATLRLDAVSLPAAGGSPAAGIPTGETAVPATRDLDECEAEITGDRQFRVLFGPGFGCEMATQFVGEIPPGRAPDHRHPYDEVVLILEGSGIAHVDGTAHPLAAGSCLHLSPGQVHCLENSGPGLMRVLGVFHPARSPAEKLAPGEDAAAT
jgi:mannose-6-phosphate isomerase-like protein (cupin superfamily)